MYAAAGGLSLARRQDRRNVRKQHHTQEGVHQNLQKRFNQLQHLHAPASTADQYFRQSEQHNVLALKAAGLDPSSRLPSYVDLNRRITSFGSTDILEVCSQFQIFGRSGDKLSVQQRLDSHKFSYKNM